MNPDTQAVRLSPCQVAVAKFPEMNEDLGAVEATNRRIFFDFLLINPPLSKEEIESISSVMELLAELRQAKQTQSL